MNPEFEPEIERSVHLMGLVVLAGLDGGLQLRQNTTDADSRATASRRTAFRHSGTGTCLDD
jgi:hypothetical protein